MDELKRFNEFGYHRDREPRLRELAEGKECLSLEAANQIKHLKTALADMLSIVEIHSKATSNNFAWAEVDCAKEALNFED